MSDIESGETSEKQSPYEFEVINRNLVFLPVPENFEDKGGPEFITSIIADPLEHFIHHPERTLSEYKLTGGELRTANWPALKIMWQRVLYHMKVIGLDKVILGKEGWAMDEFEEGARAVAISLDDVSEPEEYDPDRSGDPEAIKEDYLWLREDLIARVGKYNNDVPKFGLPEDLFE